MTPARAYTILHMMQIPVEGDPRESLMLSPGTEAHTDFVRMAFKMNGITLNEFATASMLVRESDRKLVAPDDIDDSVALVLDLNSMKSLARQVPPEQRDKIEKGLERE